jgi:aminoglycoside phosphotransferase family enzyme
LAEDIYIGLVPLTVDARGKLQLSGNGPIQDWLVKMKRIPEDLMLDNAIKNDNIDLSRLTEAAKLLARFYQASAYIPTTYSTYQKKMEKEIISTYKQLRHNDFQLPKRTIEKLINRLLNFLDTQGKLLEERLVHQRIIEAHGDLRPEHVCLLPKPVIIDRLEFSHALRVLDTAEELSYFSMECEIAGNALPGKIFLNTYSNLTKDNINEKVILFYKLKRACLRAYLIARHITEESYRNSDHWLSMANRYLVLAKHYDQMLS